MEKYTVTVDTLINASKEKVWEALVDPALIKQYMFGSEVVTDWQQGSPIVWRGEWNGKPYEDTGMILEIEPPTLLKYSHASPSSTGAGTGDDFHTITIELREEGGQTRLLLMQDNNLSQAAADHSKKNWEQMLESLKKVVEG